MVTTVSILKKTASLFDIIYLVHSGLLLVRAELNLRPLVFLFEKKKYLGI